MLFFDRIFSPPPPPPLTHQSRPIFVFENKVFSEKKKGGGELFDGHLEGGRGRDSPTNVAMRCTESDKIDIWVLVFFKKKKLFS